MIGRVMALAIGLMSGLAGAQMPEFAQQYRQRLGGAIDEMRRIVTRFDDTARNEGLTRQEAIKRLSENADPVARGQASSTEETIARLESFEGQRRAFDQAGPFERLVLFARGADPDLAQATYRDYEPAWPATSEGLAAGGAGFALGWAVLIFFSRILRRLNPFQRRRPSPRLALSGDGIPRARTHRVRG